MTTTTTRDDWLSSAMSDDHVVADLLLRLHNSPSTSSSSLLPPSRWGVRHPRSRLSFRCDSSPYKKRDSAMNSPTTPLAWSADGSDESSLPPSRSSDSRSKIVIADDPATADAKKPKKKKTFAELKGEEGSLLKERVHLKKEIATLRTTFEEHAATNENLKRIKIEFDLNSGNGATTPTRKKESASSLEEKPVLIYWASPTSQNASSLKQAPVHAEEELGRGFLLPDLNMTPCEHDVSELSCAEEIQVMGSCC